MENIHRWLIYYLAYKHFEEAPETSAPSVLGGKTFADMHPTGVAVFTIILGVVVLSFVVWLWNLMEKKK